MKPLPPPPGTLAAWSRQACATVDTHLIATEEAHRAFNRAPYAWLESCGLLALPLQNLVRFQDAMTRLSYRSLIGWNRLAGVASGQIVDALEPRSGRRD